MRFVLKPFHIGKVNGPFTLDNRAVGMLLAFSCMALDQLHAFHDQALGLWKHGDDPAVLALFFSGQHEHFIAFLDVTFHKIFR